jgi:hypothetical protein
MSKTNRTWLGASDEVVEARTLRQIAEITAEFETGALFGAAAAACTKQLAACQKALALIYERRGA